MWKFSFPKKTSRNLSPPHENVFNKIWDHNPLELKLTGFTKLLNRRLYQQKILKKLRLKQRSSFIWSWQLDLIETDLVGEANIHL